uniref:TSA: Wollemia nobilis Ref_Wollemi_Transcript_22280_1481 transcribed RNA sequence n=1 Tax=Wollemia nobilis TaxID=56998 RepID=A0A0C9S1X8_9CONI
MSYWKTKVLPKIKRYFDKPSKKKAAAEACKTFDESKESIEKELGEKKEELQPKVEEVYKPLDKDTKAIVKQPTDAAIKKHAGPVKKVLEELTKIGFPGAAPASEAAAKFGPALALGPVTYVFLKVSTFITEDVEEAAPPAAEAKTEETTPPPPAEPAETTATTTVVEETKTGQGVVEKVEKVEEDKADDGKTEAMAPVTVAVETPQPEPSKA